MIKLNNITKSFNTNNVLKDLSITFKEQGFIGITGKSGSGKTTLLNILSGIVNKDSGDFYINSQNTKNFTNKDWSFYRNQFFGFVYQDNMLLENMTVFDNLELPLLLTKTKGKERYNKILEVLKVVDMTQFKDSYPSSLSGGEKQRIAIARALINDPKVILADEPTNALDADNTTNIMGILKEISKDKLVIFVTHDLDLVSEYCDVNLKIDDGKIESFSNDNTFKKISLESKNKYNIIKPIKLNLKHQKLVTSFLIMAMTFTLIATIIISNLVSGLNGIYQEARNHSLRSYPVIVNEYALNFDVVEKKNFKDYFPSDGIIHSVDNNKEIISENILDENYFDYIETLDNNLYSDLFFDYNNRNNFYSSISKNKISKYLKELPLSNSLLNEQYDVIKGSSVDVNEQSLIFVVNNKNEMDKALLESLRILNNKLTLDDLINVEVLNVLNDDYYTKTNNGYKVNDLDNIHDSKKVKYKVSAVIRSKTVGMFESIEPGLYLTKGLSEHLSSNALDSLIYLDQLDKNYDVITGNRFNNTFTKDDAFRNLGIKTYPKSYMIYPNSFKDKEQLVSYLNEYKGLDNNKVSVTDLGTLVFDSLEEILGVTKLIMFIILIVSLLSVLILIGIISYYKINQRKKEFVIYQMIGTTKSNISVIIILEYLFYLIVSSIIALTISYLTIYKINNWYNSINYKQNPFNINLINFSVIFLILYIIIVLINIIPLNRVVKNDLNLVFKR